MKLFQRLLVAPAALGLLAPIAANATEVNLNDISNYSNESIEIDSNSFSNQTTINPLLAGGEGLNHNHDGGDSFSSTTTMTGSAVFAIGQIDGADEIGLRETTQTLYQYTLNLNTSFTGDDNLYVRLRTGDEGTSFGKKTAAYHPNRYSSTADVLAVDKIWYQFPIGDNTTAWVAPKIENYYMYAATPSLYRPAAQKAFKLGGNSAVFGASTAAGVGVKYQVEDSPWALSTNVVSKGADTAAGFLSDGDQSKWDTMIAYTKPQWHGSLTVSSQHNGWSSFSYYATSKAAKLDNSAMADGSYTSEGTTYDAPNSLAYALRTYWRPAESGTITPEVTLGYDVLNVSNNGTGKVKEANSYMIGLGWADMFRADDRIGAAFGAPLRATSLEGDGDPNDVDATMWEIYYSFKPNDSITVIPAIFGASDIVEDSEDDITGVMVTTKFKF